MSDTNRVEQLTTIQREANNLFKKKNADYGDAFAEYGTVGILVRMGDKIKRFQSITNKGINLVDDEKLRDTLIDLHNYAAMGIMLIDEDETPKLESNTELVINTWEITGDTGFCYERQCFINSRDNVEEHTCTCPSFKYCKAATPTCKHINNPSKY